jgi:tRNA 2-thiouridine synthesizing protein A
MTPKTDKRDEADVVAELSILEGTPCAGCARVLCGHHALVALVMGFKNAPRCAECLAAGLDLPYAKFRDQVLELVQARDCYRSGWKWADRREKIASSPRPACLWPEGAGKPRRRAMEKKSAGGAGPSEDAEWDAGSMGCGDLVLELRLRLGRLAPGQVLTVTARDPGAPEDLPAWCRLTGHALVESKPPLYRIRRKES